MSKKTNQQPRLIRALELRGLSVVETRRKYTIMTKDRIAFFYVGVGGSLRKGRNYTDSVPLERMKQELLKEVESA